MDLEQVRDGSFDPVRAIRLLAGEVAELKAGFDRLSQPGPGPNMDAGGQGADLASTGSANDGETVLVVKEGLRGLLNDRVADVLEQGGFETVASITAATDAALRAVDGVGPVTLREIRELIPGSR